MVIPVPWVGLGSTTALDRPGKAGSVRVMAAADDPSGDRSSSASHSSAETSSRRLRAQSQLDFELEFFGRILERDPYRSDVLHAQANNLAAKGLFARALQLDRRLVRLLPERPVPWYNLACSYAVLGMIDPAFSSLQRAVDLGYRPIRQMLRDPDLSALRRDPRFPRLLRRALISDKSLGAGPTES